MIFSRKCRWTYLNSRKLSVPPGGTISMANKKANMKIGRTLARSLLLMMLLLQAVTASWGAITNQTAVLSSDLNGDGIAGIGDTITFSCRSTTTDTTQYPFVNLSAFGNPYFPMPNIAGNFYSAFLTISPGNIENNTAQTFQFVDEDGVRIGGSLLIDNRKPYSQNGPSISGMSGLSSTFKVGDTLQIDMEMNSSLDGDIPRANLTNIGLGANHMFSRVGGADSAPVYRLALTFPVNREGIATPITVSSSDDAGNSRSWDLSLSFDTKVPEIKSVSAVNMTSGKTYITAGDAIKIQAVISNYDNDVVIASNSHLFTGGAVTMEKVSGGALGAEAVYEYIHYVTEDPAIQNIATYFEVRATDDVGNVSNPRASNYLRVDSLPPEFANLVIEVRRGQALVGNNTAIIGDLLRVYGDVTAGMKDVTLTVDMSGIGGVANQIIPFRDGSSAPNLSTTSFALDYNVFQYTSENSTPRAFTVTAKDTAGNLITRVAMPIVYVDNLPPTISAGQVQNVSRPGQPARYGDQIAITATIANIDNGSVWVNLERLGGTASSTLSPYSGSTYRIDHVVSDAISGGITDQALSFVVYAVDDAGNTVQTVTSNLSIDNEVPQILTASYTVNPALSTSHPYVRVDDRITFRVQLASSSSAIHDGETVKISLTELGQTNPVDMTYAGGYYTFSMDVPAGDVNNEHYFSFTATDNAGNTKDGVIQVKIDNSNPDVGPMSVNFLTDMNKAGAVNIGDRLEFIIPVNDPDDGYCVIDLSLIGSSSTSILTNYDSVLRRYYLTFDCIEAAVENPSYVFKAIVYDKAGNVMNSLSSTFEVDCRPPAITSFSATVQELKGKTGVINTGDKIKFNAEIDISRLDSGVPTVNLTSVGGNSNQQLYDDGAHSDGIANDGVYSYTHTVVEGTTDGDENVTFTLQITDNAGNRATSSVGPYHVDNQALVITSVTNVQKQDTNGNTIVDLDGKYTTAASFATDTVTLKVIISGNTSDLPVVTVDLTKFGYSDVASTVPWISTPTGYDAEAVIEPRVGNTNNEDVKLTVKVTDKNGNETVAQATNPVKVDNQPPKIEVYPVSFVVDNGRLGEANLYDVIQVKVKLTNHDGILPMIDFVNLYLDNGLTPPNATLFPPNTFGGNEFTYQWTVPEGLGTFSSLTIISLDASGNMSYAYTQPIRFLSKTPVFAGFPQSRADLITDHNLNNIVNPANGSILGDEVKITCVLTSLFNTSNTPAAEVLVDIRSLTNSTSDDSAAKYYDGDSKTFWVPLNYVNNTGSPYVYSGTFIASASENGIDATEVSFPVKVLHPDTPAITLASTIITCDQDNPFGIDTLIPRIKVGTPKMSIVEENGDNLASYSANIGDILRVQAEIEKLTDPGSVTAIIYMPTDNVEIFRTTMLPVTGSNIWEATFVMGTGTRELLEELGDGEWRIADSVKPKFQIYASDDAENQVNTAKLDPTPVLTIDNKPPKINRNPASRRLQVVVPQNAENWVANVGNGVASDSIYAWIDLLEPTKNSKAYVDFTPIGGTATYYLQPNGVNATRFETSSLIAFPNMYAHYRLLDGTFDLATPTFRIYVVDGAGNRDYVEDLNNELAVDTRRPELSYATYDGRVLTLKFTEAIRPDTFDINFIRIGYKADHTDVQIPLGAVVELDSTNNDILYTEDVSDEMNIQLASATKSVIADWGKRSLYISMATNNTQTGNDNITSIALDVAGNWLKPVSRNITLTGITVTADYTVRPNLVGGRYIANLTDNDRKYLYIEFDKDVDASTLTSDTLKNLAIWYNRSSNSETWVNSYRFNTLAVDSFDPLDTENTSRILRIELSQEAQDWIALKYGRLGAQFHLQINGTDYEPPPYPSTNPPLIRDFEGNSVMPILPANSVAATLTPLNTPFQISSNISLDLSSATPLLTINMQNRRARLFDDTYSESSLVISKTRPADLSRIYIYEKSDTNTGRSISLGSLSNVNPMVKWTGNDSFTDLNDFASTTVRIPLTPEALKIILSWGTSEFYLACSTNAFKDLWGNSSEVYPGTSGAAAKLTTIKPQGYTAARIHTLAITPVRPDTALFKGQPADGFFYEIAFDTATLSADVRVPIARDIQPTLELFRQDTGERLDTGRFVGWLDHNQGGITRTAIQFANTGLAQSGNVQKVPVYVKLSGFTDIFNVNNPRIDGYASEAFDLSKKVGTSDYQYGFNQTASYPMVFDNASPYALHASPTSTIGITAAGNLRVTVVFNEAMDQTAGSLWQPQLKMVQGSSTVMSFIWSRWVASDTAEFVNAAAFDGSTIQGDCYYMVGGGYDQAGNKGIDKTLSTVIKVHSKGPNVKAYRVQTFQSTVANHADDFSYNAPFSPDVAPGIATISIEFDTFPVGSTGWLRIYTSDGSQLVASLSAAPSSSGAAWEATWNGTKADGNLIVSELPITYELRFYDEAGNEGSRRGSIIYDRRAPRVSEWQFANLKTLNNKAYFSPAVNTMAKINVITSDIGQGMKMRLVKSGERINTYQMSSFSSSGYTINFEGKSSDTVPSNLSGNYEVSLVDMAGNVGVALSPNSKATATLVIDRDIPVLERITMFKVNKGSNTAVGDAVTRFNSRKNDMRIEVVEGTYLTEPLASGTAVIKIMSGSTLLRELICQQVDVLSPLFAIWDGTNSNGEAVPDGTYRIMVTDLAGNTAALTADITVVKSVFKLESVSQINLDSIRMTFSHNVNVTSAEGPVYAISPVMPAGLGIAGARVDTLNPRVVTASLTPTLTVAQHNTTYTVTVTPLALFSEDGDEITAGNNQQSFTADSRGPVITNVTYDGLSSQKKFNLVFDEQIETVSALNKDSNYKLTVGTTTVQIDEIVMRADLKSVTITAAREISEGQTYTIVASGVKDLIGNMNNSSLTFEGRDITPPVLTITAFSNPANEFDILVVIKANEDISGLPSATITQSGGTAVSMLLNAGTDLRMFIGGAHLDRNYPGVATIKVTAKDVTLNSGSANLSFSTAFVNASMRAAIKSADNKVEAVFEPGTLNRDSLVIIVPEELSKETSAAVRGARILPSVLSGLNSAQISSIRASSMNTAADRAAEELVPLGTAYNLVVPAGRLSGSARMSMKLDAAQAGSNIALYHNNGNGWKPVAFSVENGIVSFAASSAGTFAMMRDEKAPRATIVTDLVSAPLRDGKPTISWSIEEFASGINAESVVAVLDGRQHQIMLDSEGTAARFVPAEDLLGGNHEISLKVADKAGNMTVTPAIRFAVQPPLKIHEVVQFPNPARNRVNLRISTNRPDLNAEEIRVKIYDVAGDLVASTNDLIMRASNNGAGKVVQDVTWDLRNKDGRTVANGVYFARIEVRDPDNWEKKTKYSHKIAVLR